MINQHSIKTVDAAVDEDEFLRPLYESYCFSSIPDSIYRSFGIDAKSALPEDTMPGGKYKIYDNVIVLFIDAFGWNLFDRYKNKYPFLKRFVDHGTASKITSQFPSTTAVHVTTMHTGKKAWEHGIPEYRYYEPKVDTVIEPLNFSPAGEKKTKKLEIDPKLIYPKSEIYERLEQNGVDSYVFAKSNFKDSEYNIALSSDPENVSYETTADALVKFSNIFRNVSKQKRYFYLYFDQLDKISHKYGVGSPELDAEIDLLMYGLEKYLYKNALKGSNNTALFMFADHGQVNVSEDKKIYLNQLVPDIEKYLEKSAIGKAIAPGGSPRIQFVYVKKEKAQELKKLLTEKLPAGNLVLDINEMHDRKLIISSDSYSGRLPRLFILPDAETLIWWYEKDKFEINKIGNHGSANSQEMEIPFLSISTLDLWH